MQFSICKLYFNKALKFGSRFEKSASLTLFWKISLASLYWLHHLCLHVLWGSQSSFSGSQVWGQMKNRSQHCCLGHKSHISRSWVPLSSFFFQPVQQWLWGKHHWEATGIHNTFLLFSFKPHKINMSEVLKFVYKLILIVRVTNILAAPLEKSSNTNLVKTGQNQQVIFLP